MLPVMYPNNWLSNDFNDLFDNDFMPRMNATAPAINVKESDKDYEVEVAAPGLKKEHCTVNINNDGNLDIKLENKSEHKEEDKKTRYLRREFSYSNFVQTLILPDDVKKDDISAKVDNGVLTITLPKLEEKAAQVQRRIEVG
ncbi:MAG: Hsp20/alpha crystallin family protein [Prevotella sp.]|jgi:HSP20 family protein|nr:Hsp20/alpha crystallin family protein [Prevotella sp.]